MIRYLPSALEGPLQFFMSNYGDYGQEAPPPPPPVWLTEGLRTASARTSAPPKQEYFDPAARDENYPTPPKPVAYPQDVPTTEPPTAGYGEDYDPEPYGRNPTPAPGGGQYFDDQAYAGGGHGYETGDPYAATGPQAFSVFPTDAQPAAHDPGTAHYPEEAHGAQAPYDPNAYPPADPNAEHGGQYQEGYDQGRYDQGQYAEQDYGQQGYEGQGGGYEGEPGYNEQQGYDPQGYAGEQQAYADPNAYGGGQDYADPNAYAQPPSAEFPSPGGFTRPETPAPSFSGGSFGRRDEPPPYDPFAAPPEPPDTSFPRGDAGGYRAPAPPPPPSAARFSTGMEPPRRNEPAAGYRGPSGPPPPVTLGYHPDMEPPAGPPPVVSPLEADNARVTAMQVPIAGSEPGFQQLSIGALKKKEEEEEEAAPIRNYRTADDDELMASMAPPPPGLLKTPMAVRPAITSPPPMSSISSRPATDEEDTRAALRVAGMAWIVFALLAAVPFVMIGTTTEAIPVVAPAAVAGMLLLSGQRWSAYLALLGTLAYTLFFGWAGYDLLVGTTLASLPALGDLPPFAPHLLFGAAGFFLLANLVMLPGSPGIARASIGGLLVLLPALALIGMVALKDTAGETILGRPERGFAAHRVEAETMGFGFAKPAGWGTYDWNVVRSRLPFMGHLISEPTYHYVNRNENVVIGFYVEEMARGSAALAHMLKTQPTSKIEEELRGRVDGPPPAAKVVEKQDIRFDESTWTVRPATSEPAGLIIRRAIISGNYLVIVAIHGVSEQSATAAQAAAAMDAFMAEFRLVEPKKDQ